MCKRLDIPVPPVVGELFSQASSGCAHADSGSEDMNHSVSDKVQFCVEDFKSREHTWNTVVCVCVCVCACVCGVCTQTSDVESVDGDDVDNEDDQGDEDMDLHGR